MPGSTPSSTTTMTAVAEGRSAGDVAMDTNQILRRYGNALVVVALAIADGIVIWRFGVAPGILLLAAAAMLLVVTLLFRAVQAATGELDEEDALDLARAPTSAEEQKRAAIQALKDLEYERSVGKISREDFDVLIARYRGEAKRLMRTVDEERSALRGEAEVLAEEAIREALGESTGGAPAKQAPATRGVDAKTIPAKNVKKRPPATADDDGATTQDEPASAADALPAGAGASATLGATCPACGTKNDGDARFCKSCGGKLADESKGEPKPVDRVPEAEGEPLASVSSDEKESR